MDISQLRWFVALAEGGNLTKVAHQFNISAPSLSRNISNLEHEIGTKLFDRYSQRIHLNQKGELFLKFVQASLNELDNGIFALHPDDGVSIVVDPGHMWDAILEEFLFLHPNFRINKHPYVEDSTIQEVLLSDCDFWLTSGNAFTPTDQLSCVALDSDRVFLAVPENSPLAACSSVRLADVKDEPFLFPWQSHRNYSFYLNLCKKAGFSPKIVSNAYFLLRVKQVSAGKGISLETNEICQRGLIKGVTFVEIEDAPTLQPLKIYRHKDRPFSQAATFFEEYLITYA